MTEEEALSIISGPQLPDAAWVLSRPARRALSDTQALRILHGGAPQTPTQPLPLATKADVAPLPLTYHPTLDEYCAWLNLSRLPLGYRILRVALWLIVAGAMLGVMAWSGWAGQ